MTSSGGNDGAAAATARVEAFAAELDRLGLEDLGQIVVSATDPARDAARDEAERAADVAGLGALLAAARIRVRDHVLRIYGEGLYRPTMVGLNWGLSEGRTQDRVAAILAAQDAVTAAVAEPWLSEAAFVALTGPFELISRGAPVDASLRFIEPARSIGPDEGGSAPPRARPATTPAQTILIIVVAVAALAALLIDLWPIAVVVVMAGLLIARSRTQG